MVDIIDIKTPVWRNVNLHANEIISKKKSEEITLDFSNIEIIIPIYTEICLGKMWLILTHLNF